MLSAECLDMVNVVGTAELPDDFLGDISTDIFTIIGFIFFLLLFYFAEEFETSEVAVRVVCNRRRDTDDKWPWPFSLDGLAK